MKHTIHNLGQHFPASDMPDLNASSDHIVLMASVDDMEKTLPSHDSRKNTLATDALASVDGTRMMVYLTFSHLFGMSCC